MSVAGVIAVLALVVAVLALAAAVVLYVAVERLRADLDERVYWIRETVGESNAIAGDVLTCSDAIAQELAALMDRLTRALGIDVRSKE